MKREKYFYNDSLDNKIDMMEYVSSMSEIWTDTYFNFFKKLINDKGYVDYFKVATKITKPMLDKISNMINFEKNILVERCFDYKTTNNNYNYDIGDQSKLTYVDIGVEPSHVRISSPDPADIFPDIRIIQFPFFSNIVYKLLYKYGISRLTDELGNDISIPYLSMIPSNYHILTGNNNVNPNSKFELMKIDPPILEVSIFTVYNSLIKILKSVKDNVITDDTLKMCLSESKMLANYTVLVILLNLRNSYNVIANSIVLMFNTFYMKRTAVAQSTNESRYIYEVINRLLMKPESKYIWNIFLSKYSTNTYNLFIDDVKTKNFIHALEESYGNNLAKLLDSIKYAKKYLPKDLLDELRDEIVSYGEICDDVITSIFDYLYILKLYYIRNKDNKLFNIDGDSKINNFKEVLTNKLKLIREKSINTITILKNNGYPEFDEGIVSRVFSVFDERLVELIRYLVLQDIHYGDKTDILNNTSSYLTSEDLKYFDAEIFEKGYSNAFIKKMNYILEQDVIQESLMVALTADLYKNKAIEASQNTFIDKYKNEKFICDMNDIIVKAMSNINKYKI